MRFEIDPNSYRSTDIALLREIVASAETRLSAQLTASIAADQRAMVLAGFLAAAMVALTGGAVALLIARPPQSTLGGFALLTAFGFAVALFVVIYSAAPVSWGFPGTRPRVWIGDIKIGKPELDRLAERLADIENQADLNAKIMESNGRSIRIALSVVMITMGICGVAMTAHLVSAGAFLH